LALGSRNDDADNIIEDVLNNLDGEVVTTTPMIIMMKKDIVH
jgi:hypothetical protein